MDLIGKGKGQKGANWVAVRIPDDAISAHANQARITKLPSDKVRKTKEQKRLEKKLNCVCKGDWMWSKDVISFAREKGFFSGADKDFSFQAAYNPFDFSGFYACEARVWSFFNHFSSDMDRYFDYATGKTFRESKGKNDGEHMPLWIIPNRKLSAQDMKECMRDEYKGTPLDITQGEAAGPWNSKLRYGGLGFKLADENDTTQTTQYWYQRPTATQQTAWSFVAQMRTGKKGIFWFGVDDAACSCYTPMFCCINHVPECFAEGNGDSYTFSPTSAWWTFNLVANWAYTKYSRMYPHIRETQQVWDEKFNTQIAGLDEKVAGMNEEDARAFLTSYSCSQAENLVADWQRLYIYLVTKFIDGQERKEENGQFKRNPYGNSCGPNRLHFPESFLRKIAPETNHE
jgi:dipeptidase